MQQQLRVDTVGVQAMASRWDAAADELGETIAPAGLGLSYQASAAAVNVAHTDVIASRRHSRHRWAAAQPP
jgi:hypothetical protein